MVSLKLLISRVGGDRVSEKNPPHSARSGGVCRSSVKNQGKNLPEQESCIPTGRAIAADPHHGRSASPPFLPPFFRSISGRHFFYFCAFLGLPWGPQKSSKIAKSRCREVSFFRPYALLALLTDFN